jgi:predicted TPR repeat methyltransferase
VPERVRRLAAAGVPDTDRWGDLASYPAGWNARADLAADLVDAGGSLLEIGVGAGYFKSIIEDRVDYTGVDLAPVVPGVAAFNLESDRLPAPRYDCIVALGVLEYVHDLERAVSLLSEATDTLVLSYCSAEPGYTAQGFRLGMGWVNGLLEEEFLALLARHGFRPDDRRDVSHETGWHQAVFRLQRDAPARTC